MEEIVTQLVVISILVALVLCFAFWRFYPKIGKVVDKEINKIKDEAHKEEKEGEKPNE